MSFRNGWWEISELLQEVWLSLQLNAVNRSRQEHCDRCIRGSPGDHPRQGTETTVVQTE